MPPVEDRVQSILQDVFSGALVHRKVPESKFTHRHGATVVKGCQEFQMVGLVGPSFADGILFPNDYQMVMQMSFAGGVSSTFIPLFNGIFTKRKPALEESGKLKKRGGFGMENARLRRTQRMVFKKECDRQQTKVGRPTLFHMNRDTADKAMFNLPRAKVVTYYL